ncbi:hypothetical protein [Argonema antarcticum]|uniref:hypothetical protein n=1 Tax=Argonema antarcticum TaxID=2942763 RepID=UPI002011D75A|nr:hypothetical protein [Argonema antarcticum]MCL1471978.1 hypothetical protein [Argonema antarcticum A004/B2]
MTITALISQVQEAQPGLQRTVPSYAWDLLWLKSGLFNLDPLTGVSQRDMLVQATSDGIYQLRSAQSPLRLKP